jgi:hypothetical protein
MRSGARQPGNSFMQMLERLGALLGRAGFGLFLLAAAVFAVLATTFVGVMIALAAVFLSFGRGRRKTTTRQADPQTLEARRTADGWVIEPHAQRR